MVSIEMNFCYSPSNASSPGRIAGFNDHFLWQEEVVCEWVNHRALIVPRKGIKEIGNVFSAAPAPAPVVSLPPIKRKRRLSGFAHYTRHNSAGIVFQAQTKYYIRINLKILLL